MSSPDPSILSIFADALTFESPEERSAYLDRTCAGNPALREEVERLLEAHDDAQGFLETSDAPAPQHEFRPGTTIDARYKLLESIGEGGMGTVWVAEQLAPVRRKVAIKLVKPGMDSRQVLARFEAERQALALMDHPNIAKVYDGGVTEQGRPYFVMEYVKGIPLTKYCDDARLSLQDRLKLYVQVCQAVQHAHQKGIIHRDLKPSNILVCLYDGRPVPKVIDFGLAKAMHQPLTEHTLHTAHGFMVGTPLYMSPEQAEFNNLDVDTRTDIYSLGVILYELLTGSTPLEQQQFRKAALDEMLRLIKEVEPPKPSTRLSGSASLPSIAAQRGLDPAQLSRAIKGDLDWIVMKTLEKERSRRYETANGLARDVERFLNDEAVEACPPSAGYRLRKFVRRHRSPVISAVLLSVALLGGAAVSAWQAVRATHAESQLRDSLAKVRIERDRVKTQRDRAVAAEQLAEKQLIETEQQRTRAVEAEEEAKTEAAENAAVNDFLRNSLLAQASPESEPDRDIKLRTVLDRAAALVNEQFSDQPRVEAEIRHTIGQTYLELGEYGPAIEHLTRSLEVFKATFGELDESTLIAQDTLSTAFSKNGDFDRAEKLSLEALEGWERLNVDSATGKNNLATLYLEQGLYHKAEPLLLEALETRRRVQGSEHPETLQVMANLAGLYASLGQSKKAVSLFREVYEKQRRLLGAESLDTLVTMTNLATSDIIDAQFKEAEQLLLECLPVKQRILSDDHPDTLFTTTQLAMVYSFQGRYAEAKELLSKALKIQQRTLGVEHPDTLYTMSTLVATLGALEDFDAAETLARESLELHRRVLGEIHPKTIEAVVLLGQAMEHQKQYVGAEEQFSKAVEAYRQTLGDEHPSTLATRCSLANVYRMLGRNEAAETLLLNTLEVQRRVEGADGPNSFVLQAALGKVYRDQGRLAEAEQLFQQALERARAMFGNEHKVTLLAATNLLQVYDRRGKHAESRELFEVMLQLLKNRCANSSELAAQLALQGEACMEANAYTVAEAMFRECIAIREAQSPDDWLLFHVKSMLGEALAGQKKMTEAEAFLLEGYEGLHATASQIPPEGQDRIVAAINRLISFYQTRGDAGDPAQVTKWEAVLKSANETPLE